jgi:hypothetical protein
MRCAKINAVSEDVAKETSERNIARTVNLHSKRNCNADIERGLESYECRFENTGYKF